MNYENAAIGACFNQVYVKNPLKCIFKKMTSL